MFHRSLSTTLAAVALAWVVGCGGSDVPPTVDPAEAKRHLEAALESWKNGEPHDRLAERSPSIVFTEPLWKDGAQLLGYEAGPVELQGRQGSCAAKLTLKGKDGKAYERRIGYTIDTVPRVVIVRENLGL